MSPLLFVILLGLLAGFVLFVVVIGLGAGLSALFAKLHARRGAVQAPTQNSEFDTVLTGQQPAAVPQPAVEEPEVLSEPDESSAPVAVEPKVTVPASEPAAQESEQAPAPEAEAAPAKSRRSSKFPGRKQRVADVSEVPQPAPQESSEAAAALAVTAEDPEEHVKSEEPDLAPAALTELDEGIASADEGRLRPAVRRQKTKPVVEQPAATEPRAGLFPKRAASAPVAEPNPVASEPKPLAAAPNPPVKAEPADPFAAVLAAVNKH